MTGKAWRDWCGVRAGLLGSLNRRSVAERFNLRGASSVCSGRSLRRLQYSGVCGPKGRSGAKRVQVFAAAGGWNALERLKMGLAGNGSKASPSPIPAVIFFVDANMENWRKGPRDEKNQPALRVGWVPHNAFRSVLTARLVPSSHPIADLTPPKTTLLPNQFT